MLRSFIPVALALVLWTGCAPAPLINDTPEEGTVAYPGHALPQILASLEAVAAHDTLHAFSSQARLAIRSPQQNADLTATLRQRGADTLWASVRGPLSIEVARALATPDSFFLHDRLRNQLVFGPAAAAQQLFPGHDSAEEVFQTLTGTLRPDPAVRWAVNPGMVDGAPSYWLTAPDGRLRIAVDPTVWRVRRYERLGPDGRVVDARFFSEFALTEGRVLPHRIVLSNPADETELTLEHRRITLNPEPLAFPFDPSNARRVPFGEAAPLDAGTL